VIGKVLRGTNVRRLLYYLYGPGRANEHTDPHLVAGFFDPAELEPERRPGGSPDLRRLAGLLAQPLAALGSSGGDKPVWHCSVRGAPEDRVLSDAEWAQVAAGVMHRTGLAPQGDELAVRWVAVRHAPDHIHIVATLARQDGAKPSTWNDFYRVRDACQDAERRFGLRFTAPADRTAARRATRAETEQAARRGLRETPRATLRREVCTAAAGAGTEQEFFTRLASAGVLVRLRYSTTRPGQVTGYAVGLARHTARDGGVIWYGGGKLAADLTLPKLRARWHQPAGRNPLSAPELPLPPCVPCSGTRSPRRHIRPGTRQGSSPGCGSPGCSCGCGSARRTRARSPGTPSPSPATPAPPGHRGGMAAGGWPLGSPFRSCAVTGPRRPAVLRGEARRSGSLSRNGTRSTSTRPARRRRLRSTSTVVPTVTQQQRPTPRGLRLTHCMLRRGRCAARSCDVRPTPTIAPPAPVTAGSPTAAAPGIACARRHGCWPLPVTAPTTTPCWRQR
jgi:hypothetical protein